MRLAVYYRSLNMNEQLVETLNRMNEYIPYEVVGIDNGLLFEIGNLYLNAGASDRYKEIASMVEKNALAELEKNPGDVNSPYNPYRILIETYENAGDYNKLLGLWEKLAQMYPNDPTVKANIQKYKILVQQKDSLAN
jgi:hypothetical protein